MITTAILTAALTTLSGAESPEILPNEGMQACQPTALVAARVNAEAGTFWGLDASEEGVALAWGALEASEMEVQGAFNARGKRWSVDGVLTANGDGTSTLTSSLSNGDGAGALNGTVRLGAAPGVLRLLAVRSTCP